MNSLIRSISISLLSLLGMGTGFANSELELEFGPAQYAGHPYGQGADSHASGQGYIDGAWDGQDRVSPVTYKEWMPSASVRSEESKLSPEQRRALRHEINEAGRELYRH